jgi:hypothetical protein
MQIINLKKQLKILKKELLKLKRSGTKYDNVLEQLNRLIDDKLMMSNFNYFNLLERQFCTISYLSRLTRELKYCTQEEIIIYNKIQQVIIN